MRRHPSSLPSEKEEEIIVQLADINKMPYSVDHFLRMVESNLWDGLSLVVRNNEIAAALVSNSPGEVPALVDNHHRKPNDQWAYRRFADANLMQPLFAERLMDGKEQKDIEHQKYSVAFGGHHATGGPEFHIHMLDDAPENDHRHELDHHDHYDSIFGLIVGGKDVLDRFFSSRDDGGILKDASRAASLQQPLLKIKSIKVTT